MSVGALLILGFTENLLVVSFLSLFHSEARPCPNLTWRRPWTSLSSVHHIYLIWLFIAIDFASSTNTKLQHNSKGRWFWKKGFSCINKWLVQLESEVCFFFIDPQLANFTCMPKTIPSEAPNWQGPLRIYKHQELDISVHPVAYICPSSCSFSRFILFSEGAWRIWIEFGSKLIQSAPFSSNILSSLASIIKVGFVSRSM